MGYSPTRPSLGCCWIYANGQIDLVKSLQAKTVASLHNSGPTWSSAAMSHTERLRRSPNAFRQLTGITSVVFVKDATGIIWVVGHRIAHRVRMTEGTQRVVRLRWVAADVG